MNKNLKILMSGGGSGGHLFPAIAIADEIKKNYPEAKFLFVGAIGKIEMEKAPKSGYKIKGLPIAGFHRKLTLRNLLFFPKLFISIIKAFFIVKKFKPTHAIGTGGFASGPTLKMAQWLGVPTYIQEQNAFPGVTNKLLGKKVKNVFAAFEGLEKYFAKEKIKITGNPLRSSIQIDGVERSEAIAHFGLDASKPIVFITGGSLGARAINKAIATNMLQLLDGGIQLIWQCGKIYLEEYKKYERSNVRVLDFVDRMDFAYASADVIVSRAGASTISELMLVGKPVIMLPSPNVAEDHQTKNVLALVEKNAAVLVKDKDADENLGKEIIALLNDKEKQEVLSQNIKQLAKPNAAKEIVKHIFEKSSTKKQLAASHRLSTIDLKTIYLIGIGGIGMSALARYYNETGHTVKGYDKTPSPLTDKLQAEGIEICFEDNLDLLEKDASLVIYTPAIPSEHKQFNWYMDNDYRVLKRSQVLGEISKDKFCIAVAGSHGKTTVSSMIAHILNETIGCTAFLGGIATNFGTNYIYSGKEIMVVEADEFDRSFMTLHPDIAVVTSIDSDHLDIYGSLENIQAEFHAFTQLIDKKGTLIAKKDLTVHQNHTGAKSISYDIEADTDIKAVNYKIVNGNCHFDIDYNGEIIKGFELSLGGKHNVENAIAAISVAIELGIEKDKIKNALATFKGIYRRFDKKVDGDLAYIDDYAHHPNEVKALLTSVKELYPSQKISCIFQPHLFSRTKDLAADFGMQLSLADEVILLPIYPARELPVEGVSSHLILNEIKHDQKSIKTKEEVLEYIKSMENGVLLTVGAGDIDRLVPKIEEIIKANG